MTERILTQVQAPKLGFLRRVHSVTKGRTEVRLRSGQEINLSPPYLNLAILGLTMTCIEEKNCNIVATFRQRPVIPHPGHCSPLVTPLV